MKKKCSDKVPKEEQDTPNNCLRKGIYVGKNLKVPITNGLTKDVIRRIAQLNNIKGYSNMSKMDMIEALKNKRITKFKPFDLI